MPTVTVEKTIDVPLARVWETVSDFAASPWLSLDAVVQKRGDPERFGVGTERIVMAGKNRVYERIEAVEPQKSFTYSILAGIPVKQYQGRVEFSPVGNQTKITWSGTFTPKIFGTAWIIKKVTAGLMQRLIAALEKAG